jgi:kynurenine formamidase
MSKGGTGARKRGNWGRWGDADERGAANLVDAACVARATRRVEQGRTYELGIEIRRDAPLGGPRAGAIHLMAIDGGDFAALGRDDWGTADDYLILATGGTTHVDGLCHMWYDGKLYNGFPYTDVRSSGAARCGVEKLGGLVTTAHLLDFADRETERADVIGAADIERYVSERALEVGSGDALLVRTGWMEAALRKEESGRSFPAVGADAADWVADHDIAIVGADNIAVERTPGPTDSDLPLHASLLTDLGVYILELLDLSGPAADGVGSGMFVLAPLRIHRGINSPLNPLLVV